MDRAETVDAQVSLPRGLYKIIEQRAQVRGHSVSSEMVALLSLLFEPSNQLEQEFAEWEAASDEDWQTIEEILAAEAS